MSYHLKKGSMQHLWQSVCGSVKDYDESSRYATAREVLEETGLEVILGNLQYLFNNLKYDCDVYKLKVHPRTKLNRTELTKQEETFLLRCLQENSLRSKDYPNPYYPL